MASAAARRSPRTRVRSLASMATSVPVPMAMPRSAWASAAASLTPSPTMATTRPSACRRRTTSTFWPGSTSAMTSSMPDLGGDGPGRAFVVPGQQHRAQAEPGELGDRLGAGGLDGVGDDQDPADGAVPADGDRRCDRPVRRGGGRPASVASRARRPLVGQPGRAPGDDGVPVDDALHAEPLGRGELRRPAAGPRPGRGPRRRSAAATGCSEASSTAPTSASSSSSRDSGGGDDVDQAHPAGGDGAGLVQHHRVDPAGRLQDLRALDEDAQLGAPPGAHQQRGGGGQPQRAGAGDDQDGDRGGERRLRPGPGGEPEHQRRQRRGRSRPGRTRPRPGRPAVAPAPCPTARPRPGGRSARAGCPRRPGWPARPVDHRR